tara:strand:+ start:778 stop:1548 length:771 start_codon:yes stop_codon:yes gene_type:complete
MAFKMKGSPVKLGDIQGTANHTSALKKTYKEAYSAMEDVEGGKKKDQWGRIYANQGEFEVEAQKWWEKPEGQEYAKKHKDFKHKIIKDETSDDDTVVVPKKKDPVVVPKKKDPVVVDPEPKESDKKDTYGTRTEAQQNLDVRMAKRKRKQTRKKARKNVKEARKAWFADPAYNEGEYNPDTESAEAYQKFLGAKDTKKAIKRKGKLEVLQAKGEDFRDDRGLFAGARRLINRARQKALKKKIAKKDNTNSDTDTEV